MNSLKLDRNFSTLSSEELRLVDGGWLLLAAPYAAGFAAGVAVAGGLVAVAAFGYTVGKDLAESSDDDSASPEER